MTVPSVITPDKYDGDGSTRDWPITFAVDNLTETDFEIYVEEGGLSTLITTGYDVDLVTPQVTYPTVESGLDLLTSDQKIIIKPVLPITQEYIDVAVQGAIPLPAIESGFDRLTLIAQQMQEEIDRCVKSDIGGGSVDDYVTALEGYVEDAETAAEDAEAAKDAAELAETNAGLSEDAAAASAVAAAASAVAAAASAASINFGIYSEEFTSADLVDGILIPAHSFTSQIYDCVVIDNNGYKVIPEIHISGTVVTADLSLFDITGTNIVNVWGS